MSSPRIAPLEPPYSDALQQAFDVVMPAGVPPLNIFRTVGHNPRVLSRMVRGGLLDRGSISLAERELVILRACACCKASYEWGVHAALYGEKAGFSPAQLEDSWSGSVDAALWSESQQALLYMVDELHRTADLDEQAWARLKSHFADEQMVELVMLAGLYHAVSFVVNTFRVESENFAMPFPASVPA